jgi:hypothetical protein
MIIVLALLATMVGVTHPVIAGAYGTQFVTSVTYMNVGDADATIAFDFYQAGSDTPISITRPTLAQYAASSIYVGSLSELSNGFQGSGMITSDQPIAATLVQVPPSSSSVKNRPLSTAFSAGSSVVTIPTVLKNTYNTNSVFSIQNIDTVGADLTVQFIPVEGSMVTDTVSNLPAGAAKYYDMGTSSVISASSFNGTVRVVAKKTGTNNDGAVVATSMEFATVTNNTYSFEGINGGGSTVYMPSAFCNWGSGGQVNSAYAVQNTSTTDNAAVTVQYANGGTDGPHTIAPGAKLSFPGCGIAAGVNSNNYIGAATITSTGADIVAIGKIVGNGISTAYVGLNSGYEKVVLPYVRYTNSHWTDGTRQRVFIAIQNVGGSELAANSVSVAFYDLDGVLKGTITNPSIIPVGGKWSTDASSIDGEFGYWTAGTGGGAIVEGPSGADLAVIARAQTYLNGSTATGEDYNGIPLNTPVD